MGDNLNLLQGIKVEKGYKLFQDTYLIATDKCLFIVKVDGSGRIVRVSAFGSK